MLLAPRFRFWFAFVFGITALHAEKIPATLSNGIFEVTLEFDDDWRAAVFPERALIQYQYARPGDSRGTTAELMVRALRLPAAGEPETIAKDWIKKDPQKLLEEFFAGRVRPRINKKWQVENPFFSAMHGFELKLPLEGRGPYRYGRIALLFPADFAAQRVVFLVMGQEVNFNASQLSDELYRLDEIIATLGPASPAD
jgi:hypothetical protein